MITTDERAGVAEAGVYRQYQGGFFRVLLSPEQTAGSMSLIDMTLPRGVEPPMHMHTQEDETFYLLAGEIKFQIGEKTIAATKGEAVFAPRQVPHHFEITSGSARFLTLITPGKFLDYFLAYSTPATGELKIVPPQGPPPAGFIERMTSDLIQQYGVLFL